MTSPALQHAHQIYQCATPVLSIQGIGGKRWKRNVAKGGRIGPWLQARYSVLDSKVWVQKTPSLYLVSGSDGRIRYVGISRNRMKDRWRVSPAYDAETMVRLPENQLFHSQCWKQIELETNVNPAATFEVRCINAATLLPLLVKLGPPLSAFVALGNDDEGIVAGVERWLCNNKSDVLVTWNISMTR
jgi:hypothetical protein